MIKRAAVERFVAIGDDCQMGAHDEDGEISYESRPDRTAGSLFVIAATSSSVLTPKIAIPRISPSSVSGPKTASFRLR